VFCGLFIWGSILYVDAYQPPANALKIYVLAKQWMWKAEYPGGQREINSLHVPLSTPVELVMASQDVIHDFFVPAFRVKRDVLPGQYETLWFMADRVGRHGRVAARLPALAGSKRCRQNACAGRQPFIRRIRLQRLPQ